MATLKMRKRRADDWLNDDWQETTEGNELWLSARHFTIQQAYDKLKEQFGVKNMPLAKIQLGWITFGYEQDDHERFWEQMYWRGAYRGRKSYPVWYIEDSIEKYGGTF